MAETNEEEVLSRIRTLLALERNYLAEERTVLAEFRTGLAVALIAAPASTIIAYVFFIIPGEPPFLELFSFFVFAVVTGMGLWVSFRSRSKLKKIRDKKRMLREHQVAIIKSVKAANDLLGKLMTLEEQVKNNP